MKATVINKGKSPRVVPVLGGGFRNIPIGSEPVTLNVESRALLLGLTVVSVEEDAPKETIDRAHLDNALKALPGGNHDPEYVVRSMRSFYGELFTDEDEQVVRSLVKPRPPTERDRKDVIQAWLTEQGVAFETDANKETLMKLVDAKVAETAAPQD
jgi:hypothetical protein